MTLGRGGECKTPLPGAAEGVEAEIHQGAAREKKASSTVPICTLYYSHSILCRLRGAYPPI